MDDPTGKIETMVIPGEWQLSNSPPSPVTIPLPIVARPLGPGDVFIGLLYLLFAALCGSVIANVPYAAINEFPEFWILLLCALPILVACVIFAGAGLICFWDVARRNPALEITVDGLCDNRLGLFIPWSWVQGAEPVSPLKAIELSLDRPVTIRQNPFRSSNDRSRLKLGLVLVSLANLDVQPHVLTSTIMTLIRWHGGFDAPNPITGCWDHTPGSKS